VTYFNYFSEIEETFIRRRGKQLFVSPLDWALIDEWKDRGVPLHIVIRAINDVFDLRDRQVADQKVPTRPISSLSYCKSEVEAQFAEWSTSQVGKSPQADGDDGRTPTFTIDAVKHHIDGAIEKLEAVDRPEIVEALRWAIVRLNLLRDELTENWEHVDGQLNATEKELEAAMITSWKSEEFEPIEKSVAAQLAEYKDTMEPEAYQRTFSIMLLKQLRDKSGIPRLGLFYL
jgi:hypothetical protein